MIRDVERPAPLLDKSTRVLQAEEMNHKRGVVALIAAFLFIFLFGFIWHGILMKPYYMQMPEHWRAAPVFGWLIFGHVLLAFAFTGLYVSKVGVNSVGTGFGYGFVMGMFAAAADILRFATEPLSATVLWLWIVGVLIQFSITGMIVGAIYKPLGQDISRTRNLGSDIPSRR